MNQIKIETVWAIGNFMTGLAVEVNQETLQKLAALGLRYVGQRVSEVDKILGAFEKGTDGKTVRRKDFKRAEVDYSDELAGKLSGAFAELELEENVKINPTVNVSQYVPTTKEPKYADERGLLKELENRAKLVDWITAKLPDFSGETKDTDGNYTTDLLVAVKAWKVAAMKKLAEL